MTWVESFYSKQSLWSGCYEGPIGKVDTLRAELITSLGTNQRLLELGCGGGQTAVACALQGHKVHALELVNRLADHARKLASIECAPIEVETCDFYEWKSKHLFDVVCYWDGFGIGTDIDQLHLLSRISNWLRPGGYALIDIYNPFYAYSTIGAEHRLANVTRQYDFDSLECRWIDTWWLSSNPFEKIVQTLRCYTLADIRLLLSSSELHLNKEQPYSENGHGSSDSAEVNTKRNQISYTIILRK